MTLHPLIPKDMEHCNPYWAQVINSALNCELSHKQYDKYGNELASFTSCVVGELYDNPEYNEALDRVPIPCEKCEAIGGGFVHLLDYIENADFKIVEQELKEYVEHVKKMHPEKIEAHKYVMRLVRQENDKVWEAVA